MQSEEQMKPSWRVTEGRGGDEKDRRGGHEGGTPAPVWKAAVARPSSLARKELLSPWFPPSQPGRTGHFSPYGYCRGQTGDSGWRGAGGIHSWRVPAYLLVH